MAVCLSIQHAEAATAEVIAMTPADNAQIPRGESIYCGATTLWTLDENEEDPDINVGAYYFISVDDENLPNFPIFSSGPLRRGLNNDTATVQVATNKTFEQNYTIYFQVTAATQLPDPNHPERGADPAYYNTWYGTGGYETRSATIVNP